MAFFYEELPVAAGASRKNPPYPVEISAGTVHESLVKYTVPSGATLNGTSVEMVRLPARARVVDVTAGTSGQAATFAVGDGDDIDRYITSAAVSAGNVTRMNAATGFGYSYPAEDTVDLRFGAEPTAGGVIFLRVTYVYE